MGGKQNKKDCSAPYSHPHSVLMLVSPACAMTTDETEICSFTR